MADEGVARGVGEDAMPAVRSCRLAGVGKRSRPRLFRSVAVAVVAATLAYSLSAGAAPVHVHAASDLGPNYMFTPPPVTLTYPGGDIVASFADGGQDPNLGPQGLSTSLWTCPAFVD